MRRFQAPVVAYVELGLSARDSKKYIKQTHFISNQNLRTLLHPTDFSHAGNHQQHISRIDTPEPQQEPIFAQTIAILEKQPGPRTNACRNCFFGCGSTFFKKRRHTPKNTPQRTKRGDQNCDQIFAIKIAIICLIARSSRTCRQNCPPVIFWGREGAIKIAIKFQSKMLGHLWSEKVHPAFKKHAPRGCGNFFWPFFGLWVTLWDTPTTLSYFKLLELLLADLLCTFSRTPSLSPKP